LLRSLHSLCLMARCARGDVRRGAAVFVGSDETTVSENQLCILMRFVGSSCRSAARTSRARIALLCRLLRRRSGTKSVSPRSSSARRRAIPAWLLRSLRSLRPDRAFVPPTSSSLRDEKRVPSLLLSTAPRDPVSAKRQDAWPGCV